MYYLVYPAGPGGDILGPAEILDCPDDATAVAKAELLLKGHDLEVIQGTRLVRRLRGAGRSR
jgi:hypothetical protein